VKFQPTWTAEQRIWLMGMAIEDIARDEVKGALTWEWSSTPFGFHFRPGLTTAYERYADGIQVASAG
jgi:hypothetical protein